jgi:hypothetical protein
MKNAQKYLQLYLKQAEESFAKWGYYYPPRNWEELYAWDASNFQKYLKDESDAAKRVKFHVKLLNTTKEFGFYVAFQSLDYATLNDVVYQTSRHTLLDQGMLASGSDHCNVLMEVLCALASNDYAVIDAFFPKDLPHSKGTYYTEVAVNLLRVLYHGENALKEEALSKATQFLTKKRTDWERYVVGYFVALVNRDASEASACLQKLCVAYQKAGYPVDALDKCFATEIHGLYRFAQKVDASFFDKLTPPKHLCFSTEFEAWQQTQGYPKGKLFYRFPAELDLMNKILEAPLPTVTLHEVSYPRGKEIYKDVDQFAANLTENVRQFL